MNVTVCSPWDRSVIKNLELGTMATVEALLKRASGALGVCKGRPEVWERKEILKKTAAAISEKSEEFALTIAKEGGKPLVDARIEVARAIQGIELAMEEMGKLAGEEIPMGITPSSKHRLAFTTRDPIGVVVAVSAFNHPLNLIVHQVIPAVAAGCPVIVKPAIETPLSCMALVDLLHKSGLPEAWCQLALLDIPEAEALVTDSRVNFFSFIGSAKVGWHLRSLVAPGTRCALEHGGAAPVIVAEDADIDTIIAPLAKGGFYHAGQVCVSVQRVFAHRKVARQLAEKLAEKAKTLVVGDPTLETTDVGPLIRPGEVSRVQSWVDEGVEMGGTTFCGGKALSETCFEPTVLFDPPDAARVSCLEVFGPVVCVYPVDDVWEGVKRANALPVAFQASVFTPNLSKALQLARHLDAAAVMLNDHTAFRVDWMPFGGRRQSGMGVGGIGQAMHEMTQEKLIVMHHGL